jgi:hypothetical protein
VHDGSTYQVVQVFYEPEELQVLLDRQGWSASFAGTRSFVFGDARLRPVPA